MMKDCARLGARLGRLFIAGLALLAACVSLAYSNPAHANPIDEASKAQIEAVIKDYLLKNPVVIRDAIIQLQRQEAAAARERSKVALMSFKAELLDAPASPSAGNPKGDVTIVEFFDFQCGYCKQVAPMLSELLRADPGVRIVFKQFPVLGPKSVVAAKLALAAAKQGKYQAFHEALLSVDGFDEAKLFSLAESMGLDPALLRRDMASSAVSDEIEINSKVGASLGITGTPAFVVGDTLVPGAVDLNSMRQLVATTRQQSNAKQP